MLLKTHAKTPPSSLRNVGQGVVLVSLMLATILATITAIEQSQQRALTSVSRRHILFVTIFAKGHSTSVIAMATHMAKHYPQFRYTFASEDAAVETLRRQMSNSSSSTAAIETLTLGEAGNEEKFNQKILQTAQIKGPAQIMQIIDDVCELAKKQYPKLYSTFAQAKPDLIVSDFASLGGLMLAYDLQVPLVVNTPGIIKYDEVSYIPLWRTEFDAPKFPLTLKDKLNNLWFILTLVRSLVVYEGLKQFRINVMKLPNVSFLEYFRPQSAIHVYQTVRGFDYSFTTAPNHLVNGPIIAKDFPPLTTEIEKWIDNGDTRPVVYIAFGTMAPLSSDTVAAMLANVQGKNYRVLWSLRNAFQQATPQVATKQYNTKDILINAWVPQMAALGHEKVKVFVSHCGFNSAHESLYMGKPIVAVPVFADQFEVARRVEFSGIGVIVDVNQIAPQYQHISTSKSILDESIQLLLSNETFAAKARALSVVVRGSQGVETPYPQHQQQMYANPVYQYPQQMPAAPINSAYPYPQQSYHDYNQQSYPIQQQQYNLPQQFHTASPNFPQPAIQVNYPAPQNNYPVQQQPQPTTAAPKTESLTVQQSPTPTQAPRDPKDDTITICGFDLFTGSPSADTCCFNGADDPEPASFVVTVIVVLLRWLIFVIGAVCLIAGIILVATQVRATTRNNGILGAGIGCLAAFGILFAILIFVFLLDYFLLAKASEGNLRDKNLRDWTCSLMVCGPIPLLAIIVTRFLLLITCSKVEEPAIYHFARNPANWAAVSYICGLSFAIPLLMLVAK